jgi:hypothetical protein
MFPFRKYNADRERNRKISPYGFSRTNGMKVFGIICGIILLILMCWLIYRLPRIYTTFPWTNW